MSPMKLRPLILAAAVLGTACSHTPNSTAMPAKDTAPLRLASYNVSLYTDRAGGLVEDLQAGSEQAARIAAVLQTVRPDIVLVNEFDFDADGRAADLFQRQYLEVAQPGGGQPLHYAYRYLAPVNTGVPSGLDLDNDGQVGGKGRAHGNDAWGYGVHPGQYGMLLLSRHPIDTAAVRTFQLLKWHTLPDARRPRDPETGTWFWPDAVWQQLRLSSKSHWDVPVDTPAGRLHVLASHPTPPAFDGPEMRNVARNADELALWRHYLDNAPASAGWLCDDQGRCGGLADDARYVIMGDLNNDPSDGNGHNSAIIELLEHPRSLRMATPSSEGAAEVGAAHAARGIQRNGNPAHATGDFGPRAGSLRLDYVIPSAGWQAVGSGVYWPLADSPAAALTGASDHHLVWVDVR